MENVICLGVIPGPTQCKDLNSFLVPVMEEMLQLQDGVPTTKPAPAGNVNAQPSMFLLRAFILILFGDIPAVTKLLSIKGHNAMMPCRTCYAKGVLCKKKDSNVYYVPTTLPNEPNPFPCDMFMMRSHSSYLSHYDALDAARTIGSRKQIMKDYGINKRTVFAQLGSINLATCAPYDFMHLIFENLVPNMILHWTGKFKELDTAGDYAISDADWKTIGRLTTQATKTIPSTFVGTLPDIAKDQTLFKAEAYSFWIQYIAPIVLKGRLADKYYQHILLMREIVLTSLLFEITEDELTRLQQMVNQWVTDYERHYYKYKYDRLPACPLTIHALLHLPYYIRHTGPAWTSWSFVMERLCGHLLPAVKNRVRPYEHLDNYVQRRAQMQVVSLVYNLPSLSKPRINYTYEGGEKLSSRETFYPEFPNFVLGIPVNKHIKLRSDKQLTNQIRKYFGTVYPRIRGQALLDAMDANTLVRYGRLRLTGDGDKVRTAALIDSDPGARDNSYVKYDDIPDKNTAFRNAPDVLVRETNYGRLMDIYYIEFIEDARTNTRKKYLLARVRHCKTNGLDAANPRTPVVTYTELDTPDIIHLNLIDAVVGRIRVDDKTWAIVDRSRNGARTQFTDDDGNDWDG